MNNGLHDAADDGAGVRSPGRVNGCTRLRSHGHDVVLDVLLGQLDVQNGRDRHPTVKMSFFQRSGSGEGSRTKPGKGPVPEDSEESKIIGKVEKFPIFRERQKQSSKRVGTFFCQV